MTGEITVIGEVGNEIGCDVPPRDYLEYRIIATDSLHRTPIDIKIHIIDTNNKFPAFFDFLETVSIYEDQSEGLVVRLAATDLDRDEQYRDFDFQIDYSNNRVQMDLFAIEEHTENLVVRLQNGQELDRDNGVTQHVVTIVVTDHQGLGSKWEHNLSFRIVINKSLCSTSTFSQEQRPKSGDGYSVGRQ